METEANFFSTIKKMVPELLEPNWRLWSFLAILLFAIVALFVFPVKEYKGLIDPFYSPTILVVPVVGLFRLTCYAYRKDYYRNIWRICIKIRQRTFINECNIVNPLGILMPCL